MKIRLAFMLLTATLVSIAPAETVITSEKSVQQANPAVTNAGTATTYSERAETAYRTAGIPEDVIIKLRDYDSRINAAHAANNKALVKQYYTDQLRLLSSQHINGIRTYLKANPAPATTAVTVWEDPAYSSITGPSTIIAPDTVITEVRTAPVAVRQIQVPVTVGSVPLVVKDPIPVVRTEVSAPVIRIESTPMVTTIKTTEETVTTVNKSSKSDNLNDSSQRAQ